MRDTSTSISADANCGGAETCGGSRNILRHDAQVVSACQAIFPIKAALHIADLTGYPLRTVEYWFAGGKMPADALARLLRTEHGVRILSAIMADAQPSWWRKIKSYILKLDALAFQRAAQRKLQEAIHEDAQFNADLARVEAAMPFSDEDFLRPHVDALRAAGPRPNSAVVQKVKR